MDFAILGAGCFWCVEAIFQKVSGISNISCGYSGGKTENPSYEEICSKLTGHAEVIQFTYNSVIISYEDILNIFWETHDPTTINQQGADKGTQYRSVIFYHNDSQRKIAEQLKKNLNLGEIFDSDVITEIEKFNTFYIAEECHQQYFKNNPSVPYCNYVIKPKLEKFISQYKKS